MDLNKQNKICCCTFCMIPTRNIFSSLNNQNNFHQESTYISRHSYTINVLVVEQSTTKEVDGQPHLVSITV